MTKAATRLGARRAKDDLRRNVTAHAAVAIGIFLLAACSSPESVSLEENPALSKKLTELRQTGGSATLADWTGSDWDSVFVSHHPVSRDYVESRVGGKINMDDTFMQRGNLLVFLNGGEIVRAIYITPDLLQPGRYSNRVQVTTDGYPALLQMSE
ncbi:hypothetical protein ACL02S_20750 [Nocardia sp. 004]|uniref:hypothetical protein n=1 Tax=Nocardia sp. 004 TaxID=3385978 RepID=UPI00399F8EA0